MEIAILIIACVAAALSAASLILQVLRGDIETDRHNKVMSNFDAMATALRTRNDKVENMVQGVGFAVADIRTDVRGIKSDTRKRLYTAVVRELSENLPDSGKELAYLTAEEDDDHEYTPADFHPSSVDSDSLVYPKRSKWGRDKT